MGGSRDSGTGCALVGVSRYNCLPDVYSVLCILSNKTHLFLQCSVDTYDVTSHTCGPGCQFDNGTSLWAAVLRPSVLSIDGEDILRVRL